MELRKTNSIASLLAYLFITRVLSHPSYAAIRTFDGTEIITFNFMITSTGISFQT